MLGLFTARCLSHILNRSSLSRPFRAQCQHYSEVRSFTRNSVSIKETCTFWLGSCSGQCYEDATGTAFQNCPDHCYLFVWLRDPERSIWMQLASFLCSIFSLLIACCASCLFSCLCTPLPRSLPPSLQQLDLGTCVYLSTGTAWRTMSSISAR